MVARYHPELCTSLSNRAGSHTVWWLLHWAWRFIQVSSSLCSHQAAACACLVSGPAHRRQSWCGTTAASPMSYKPLQQNDEYDPRLSFHKYMCSNVTCCTCMHACAQQLRPAGPADAQQQPPHPRACFDP